MLAGKSVYLECFVFLCALLLHHGVQHPAEWQNHVAPPMRYGVQTISFCILSNDNWRVYTTRVNLQLQNNYVLEHQSTKVLTE